MDRSRFHPQQLLRAVSLAAERPEAAAKMHLLQTLGDQLLDHAGLQPGRADGMSRQRGRPADGTSIVPNAGETIPGAEQ